MPEITLKAVVLPAPFGPIRACRLRSLTRKLAPWTALMPPKLLKIPSTVKIAPCRCAVGFRKAGSSTLPACRPAMAASSTVFAANGAQSRSPKPTRPVGENTMKATNNKPK